mgnify:FL=1
MFKKKEIVPLERFCPDINIGLSENELEERKKRKLVNVAKNKSSKSVLRILFENIFTYFNLIWAIIFVALMCVEAYSDLIFMIPVVLNTLIAIIQEIKAKYTVEKLSLVSSPKLTAIRDGKRVLLHASHLYPDDIIELTVGNQIPADCIIVSGEAELNESLLTGESNAIRKKVGDTILAGSFIFSGTVLARVDKLIGDSYIQTIATEAKKFKKPNSNLFKDLQTIIKYIGIIIIPIGGLMFLNNYLSYAGDPNWLKLVITKTCGSLTGMVPAGMFLLVTIALTVGVIKLATKHTLVKDLYSIEMLARTNMLCLDKTGTITDGTMNVIHYECFDESVNFELLVQNILSAQKTSNSTFNALLSKFGTENALEVGKVIEFSSDRKYSATRLGDSTYLLGAPEFSCKNLSEKIKLLIEERAKLGERVLLISKTQEDIDEEHLDRLPATTQPLGIITLVDHIRDDAIDTINWFKTNGVKIKIISGDNPNTVSTIARRVGVEDAEKCISLENLSPQQVKTIADQYTVFGRVTPEQKHILVKTLKTLGYVVAMTGDGVNDTLALKEADCSIAMADGSDVARNISSLVLMDSKFSSLPRVVKEGRQVINNVHKSSTLFLMKTLFTITLSTIILLIALVTFSAISYPFTPKQLSLLEFFVIGVPSFLLALQPNDEQIKGNFIPMVLKKAVPSALLMLLNVGVVLILGKFSVINVAEQQTLCVLVLTVSGFINLVKLCFPFNALRTFCVILSGVCIIAVTALMPEFFEMQIFNGTVFLILGIVVLYSVPLQFAFPYIEKWIAPMFKERKKKEKKK